MRRFRRVGLWVFIVALAGCLAACTRDPNVRKHKFFESGARYFAKGEYRDAAIQFSNAIRIDPKYEEAHYQL
ncbi:MAG: tetratricopeptide repeat protein, partial [Terriglobia bacterium]